MILMLKKVKRTEHLEEQLRETLSGQVLPGDWMAAANTKQMCVFKGLRWKRVVRCAVGATEDLRGRNAPRIGSEPLRVRRSDGRVDG